MKNARMLHRILDLRKEQRFPVIGEGLTRIGDHVDRLSTSIDILEETGQTSGATALRAICMEESAKALILLDLARTMHNQSQLQTGCTYFYKHLPRCIYAAVHSSNPADFAEIEGYIPGFRESHYLDGPNDIDWIWRNDLLRTRENALYVDYEETDAGYMWLGGDSGQVFVETTATKLVLSMRRAGLLTEKGARATAIAWTGAEFGSSTRWEFCKDRNIEVLESVLLPGTPPTEELARAVTMILTKWTFPLLSLDLTEKRVSLKDLREQQDHALSRHYGMDDYW